MLQIDEESAWTGKAEKFADLEWTARGERRAFVALTQLETLWFNTGTLCNITCANCYIESSPRNDRLAYLTLGDVTSYLDEISSLAAPVSLIGYTGGEPFMNPDILAILEETLRRGFETLILTNAMKPMHHCKSGLARLAQIYRARMRVRVSLDHFLAEVHEAERGTGTFAQTLEGLGWLARSGVQLEVAGRFLSNDEEAAMREGYAALFAHHGIEIDCKNAQALVLLPEMTPRADPPEITDACWGILHKSPREVMCANARMIVKRKGAQRAAVVACTLLPYDSRFELGATLREASRPVPLAHPHCATFCVLGGGSCGTARPAS